MTDALAIRDLTVRLTGGKDIVRGVSLVLPKRSIVSVVGGSGSGKTTVGLAVLGLLPAAMRRYSGSIQMAGQELTSLSAEALRAWRGKRIAMVFQEPMSAFNPVMTIGAQIAETLQAHEDLSPAQVKERVLAALRSAGLTDPARVSAAYAFELSGGLRQRSMIAQAIACHPQLLIADEPTSSLDVMTQDKILDLFQQLRREMDLSILLVTHDLGVVRRIADQVVIMRQGEVVERGVTARVLASPAHEYTRRLLDAE